VVTFRFEACQRRNQYENDKACVAGHITQFVKLDIFRRVKFINSDAMFQNVFLLAIDFENVPLHVHLRFQMLYESAFNDALNTQRSSCEQAGKKSPGKPLPSSENVVNNSTHLMNSASSGEPQQKGSKGHSSGSFTCSCNVYVELSTGERQRS
jgi:hypothetical protein